MTSQTKIPKWGIRYFAVMMVPSCVVVSVAVTAMLTLVSSFADHAPGSLQSIFIDQLLHSGSVFLFLFTGICAAMCFAKFFLFVGSERVRETQYNSATALVALGFVGLLFRPAVARIFGGDHFLGPYGPTTIASVSVSFVFGAFSAIGLMAILVRPMSAKNLDAASKITVAIASLAWLTPIVFAVAPRDAFGGVLWAILALAWLFAATMLAFVCFKLSRSWASKTDGKVPVGTVSASMTNGLPSVSWVQEVGTATTKASEHSRLGLKLWGAVVVSAGIFGLVTSGSEDMFFYAMIAAFFGLFGLRGVHASYANGGIQYSGLTEQERNDETIPITKREDCEAWVQLQSGEPVFCLARGDRLAGPLSIVAQFPLRELGNFEISTHSAWLRSATEIDKRRDWGVIINETANSGVVVIAEWVHAPRWLTELRGVLSKSFDGVERERIIAAADEAKRQAAKGVPTTSDTPRPATTGNVTPKRKF